MRILDKPSHAVAIGPSPVAVDGSIGLGLGLALGPPAGRGTQRVSWAEAGACHRLDARPEPREAHMLKKVAFVGVLALVGLVAGIAITGLGGLRVEIGSTLYLPAHNSPHTSSELVAMTRGHHPGAQVWGQWRGITIEASGSFVDAEDAMRMAYGEIVASNDRKFKSYYPDFADQVGFTWGNRLL